MRARRVVALLGVAILCACSPPGKPVQSGQTETEEEGAFGLRVEELEAEIGEEEALDFEEPETYPSPSEKVTLSPAEVPMVEPGTEMIAEDAALAPALRIHIFDLGQADSMLVIGPPPEEKTLLIDLGEDRSRDPRENYLHVAQRILDLTQGKRDLDYFVVSHFHDDHIGGWNDGIGGLLNAVNPQFTIDTFIDAGDEGDEYMKERRGTLYKLETNLAQWEGDEVKRRLKAAVGDAQIDLGGNTQVEIVSTGGKASASDDGALALVDSKYPGRYDKAPGSENDLSVALEISCGDFELFTAGDLTGYDPSDWTDPSIAIYTPKSYEGGKRETYTNVERYLVKQWATGPNKRETDVEVYRGNHHGSQYSTSPEFLNVLDPEVVIYSTGGMYGHPRGTIVRRVADTAEQLSTTRVANSSWQTWQAAGGELVGEVRIVVDASCESYTVEGKLNQNDVWQKTYEVFSDSEEAAEEDQG